MLPLSSSSTKISFCFLTDAFWQFVWIFKYQIWYTSNFIIHFSSVSFQLFESNLNNLKYLTKLFFFFPQIFNLFTYFHYWILTLTNMKLIKNLKFSSVEKFETKLQFEAYYFVVFFLFASRHCLKIWSRKQQQYNDSFFFPKFWNLNFKKSTNKFIFIHLLMNKIVVRFLLISIRCSKK